jgi:hypothetical protein
MKKWTVLIAIVLLLSACIRGSGRLDTESRDVRDFDRVALTGSGELTLTQGETESLTGETDLNVMRYVTSEVRGGTLVLGTRSGVSVWPTRLRFTVGVRDLAGLTVSGSGDIVAERIDTDRLEITTSGSGDVRVNELAAEEVEVRISGSGNVDVAGKVNDQELTLSGSGKYRAEDLRSEAVTLRISGSGSATLWVTDSLEGRISGSGSVSYYGDPTTDVSTSGSGRAKALGDK